MIRHKSLLKIILTIAALVYPFSSLKANPELLSYLPSSCEFVAVSTSLGLLSQKVDFFAKQLDIEMDASLTEHIAKGLNQELGLDLSSAIDSDKPVCLALTNIVAANNSVVVLLPVLDSADLMGRLEGQKLSNGSVKCSSNMFVASKGNYILLANNEFNMSVVLGSQSPFVVSESVLEDIKSSELTVYINVTNLINVVRPILPGILMSMPDYKDNPEVIESFQRVFTTLSEISSISMAFDHSEKGLAVKQNIFIRPGGGLAPMMREMDKVDLKRFESFPSGNIVSLSAMDISPEFLKSAYSVLVDFIAIGNVNSNTDEAMEPFSELISIAEKVIDTYGEEIGTLVSADYFSGIKKERLEEQIYSITDSDLELDVVKAVWKDLSELTGFSLYKVNSCNLDAGEVSGCKYSNMNITVNQSYNNEIISSYDLDIYMGKCPSGLIAQAMDRSIFEEALVLANSESETLAGHPMLKTAMENLPSQANFYFIADVNTYVDIMLANYNQQAPLMAQTSPELAIPLAAVGPVMNMFNGLEGTVGCSVDVNDQGVRIINFCDTKVLDSLVSTIKTIKDTYNTQPTEPAAPVRTTEF